MHLWLVDLLASDPELRQAERLLSPDELARARRFHFERDARRFVVAHAALRSILGCYLGRAPANLFFETNPYGKPSLATSSSPDAAGLTFNLSHSGELSLVALAAGRQVGVDIEQVRPEFASGQIAEHFFSPVEMRALASLPAEERTAAFFRCWTRKEAFVKARGQGLSLPLTSFDVTLLPGAPPALLEVRGAAGEAAQWSLHAVPVRVDGSYEAAVVIRRPVTEVFAWLYMKKG